jgi:hypothetical protein
MSDTDEDLGNLIVGAKPLAVAIFNDASKHRSVVYSPALRRDLGLFLMGGRLCGYEGVIRRRIAAKLAAASSADTAA